MRTRLGRPVRAFAALAAFAWLGASGTARAADAVPAAFAPVAFLLGAWSGTGSAEGTSSVGSDVFRLDLGGNVIVRRSHATERTAAGSGATSYDGLLIVYPDATAPAGLRAESFDSGGHVIRYALVAGGAPNVAQFLSDGPTMQPAFRLTYALHGGGDLEVTFEAAPPGSAAFATVAHGTERRSP